jgi:hypothetical protein
VAFMFIQDSPSNFPASAEIEEGEIHWLPYGRVMRGELEIVEAAPSKGRRMKEKAILTATFPAIFAH